MVDSMHANRATDRAVPANHRLAFDSRFQHHKRRWTKASVTQDAAAVDQMTVVGFMRSLLEHA